MAKKHNKQYERAQAICKKLISIASIRRPAIIEIILHLHNSLLVLKIALR